MMHGIGNIGFPARMSCSGLLPREESFQRATYSLQHASYVTYFAGDQPFVEVAEKVHDVCGSKINSII